MPVGFLPEVAVLRPLAMIVAVLLLSATAVRAQTTQAHPGAADGTPATDAAASAPAAGPQPARRFTGCLARNPLEMLADMASAPPSSLEPASFALAAGETVDFRVDRVFTEGAAPIFCAWVIWDDRAIRPRAQWASIEGGENTANGACFRGFFQDKEAIVDPQRADIVSVVVGDSGASTQVRVALPATRFIKPSLWCAARLMLALYEPDGTGDYRVTLAFNRVELFSNYRGVLTLTLAWVALIYLGCAAANAQALRRRAVRDGRPAPAYARALRRSLNPAVLTAEMNGRASLSNLQVFGFSLLVAALVLFILLRLGTLADLSADILLLLGIAAVGTAGGKLADQSRNRLSAETYAWLRQKGWLASGQVETCWSQLFTTDGTLDVTKLQMGAFSLVVAFALGLLGSFDLSTFDIPDTLLGVLGLSQGVYVAGKAVTPPTFRDYDRQVGRLREAEQRYRQAPTPQARADYAQAVRLAATMHREVFGNAIPDELREPPEPSPGRAPASPPTAADAPTAPPTAPPAESGAESGAAAAAPSPAAEASAPTAAMSRAPEPVPVPVGGDDIGWDAAPAQSGPAAQSGAPGPAASGRGGPGRPPGCRPRVS